MQVAKRCSNLEIFAFLWKFIKFMKNSQQFTFLDHCAKLQIMQLRRLWKAETVNLCWFLPRVTCAQALGPGCPRHFNCLCVCVCVCARVCVCVCARARACVCARKRERERERERENKRNTQKMEHVLNRMTENSWWWGRHSSVGTAEAEHSSPVSGSCQEHKTYSLVLKS